jgi:hypothetical protein
MMPGDFDAFFITAYARPASQSLTYAVLARK